MTTTKTEPAPPRPQHSVWSEYTPYPTLSQPAVLTALAARDIQLAVAVTPSLVDDLVGVLRACQEAGVRVAVWPMLSDAAGRWASTANAEPYCQFVRALLARLAVAGTLPEALAIDLEPPIDRVRQLTSWGKIGRGKTHARPAVTDSVSEAVARLAALTEEIKTRGLSILAAVIPPIVMGPEKVALGWQRILQTPIEPLHIDRVSTMAYTSLLQGYSRGILRREDARALLWTIACATRDRYQSRASISLGAVGTGALGDERTYRSPAELVEDVSLVRAAGITDLMLFNLDGALTREPLAEWLDALVLTAPATTPPPYTLRAHLIWQSLRGLGYAGQLF